MSKQARLVAVVYCLCPHACDGITTRALSHAAAHCPRQVGEFLYDSYHAMLEEQTEWEDDFVILWKGSGMDGECHSALHDACPAAWQCGWLPRRRVLLCGRG